MVINPKNLHPTLGTCYLHQCQSILTSQNLETVGKGRVYMYLPPTGSQKNQRTILTLTEGEVLKHHRTGFLTLNWGSEIL